MTVTQNINIALDGQAPFDYIVAKQGEQESRIVLVTLTENSKLYEIPTSAKVRIKYVKPSGARILNDCVVSDNVIIIEYTKQMLAEYGTARGEIVLYDDNSIIRSATFYTKVVERLYNEEGLITDDEFLSISKSLLEVDQAAEKAKNIIVENEVLKNDVEEALDNTYTALSNVEMALEETSTAILNADTATNNANMAAENANAATSEANEATIAAIAAAAGEANGAVVISNLDEATEILPTDLLLLANSNKATKLLMSRLVNYIETTSNVIRQQAEKIIELETKTKDDGWITATLESGFAISDLSAGDVIYKKTGSKVEIQGIITHAWNGTGTELIFTLPPGYRPARRKYELRPSAGTRYSRIIYATDGQVLFEFNRLINDGSTNTTETWTDISVNFETGENQTLETLEVTNE